MAFTQDPRQTIGCLNACITGTLGVRRKFVGLWWRGLITFITSTLCMQNGHGMKRRRHWQHSASGLVA